MPSKDPRGSKQKKKIKLATIPRDDEWTLVSQQLELRRSAPRKESSIINMIGTFGIGKTILLHTILQDKLRAEYPDTPVSLIDFRSLSLDESSVAPQTRTLRVLEQLINPIQAQAQLPADEFTRACDEFAAYLRRLASEGPSGSPGAPGERTDVERELSIYEARLEATCVGYIQDLVTEQGRAPVVLLIDSLDDAPESLFSWLEQSILDPLTSSGRVVCVLASRQELGWQLFDTRKRVHLSRLALFDDEETAVQVSERLSGLADELNSLTFGLPGATRLMIEDISQIEARDSVVFDQSVFEQYQPYLIQDCLQEQFLDGYVFRDVPIRLREMLFVLSPLRYFTVNIAASLFPQMMLYYSYQLGPNGIDTLGIIRDFIQTTLVTWDREKQGYIIAEPIRKIQVLVLRTLRPPVLLEIHRATANIYSQFIPMISLDKRAKYIVEWIYHTVHVLAQDHTSDLDQTIQADIQAFVRRSYYDKSRLDISSLNKLYQLVERNEDLKSVCESLDAAAFDAVLAALKPDSR